MMTFRLDLRDKKIIYELDLNSRQSASELAKKVGLSKQGCTYKIRKLKEKGILESTIAILNTPLMEHLSFRMYFKLIDISPEKEKQFQKWLTEHKLIPWVIGCEGIWDYIIVVFPKDFEEFQKFSQEINNNWGAHIEQKNIALVTEAHHFRAGYILGYKKDVPALIYGGQPKEKYELNPIEEKILAILSHNARTGLVEIGGKLDLPAKTISYYIKKMEKANLIEGYTIRINYEAIGFERYKIFIKTKNTSDKKEKIFKEWARMHPHCLYWSKAISTSDIEIEIIVENSIQMREIVAEMREKFGEIIKSYETTKIWKEFKLNFIPWIQI